MLIDFRAKSLTECDGIGVIASGIGSRLVAFCESEMEVIKKVEACPVQQAATARLVLRAKEDGRGEDPLKALYDAPVIATVLGESEELQHLRSAIEMDRTASLPKCQSCHPNGNEAVLTKRQPKLRVGNDLKEETPVTTFVKHLGPGDRAERESAQDKGSGIECEFLLLLLTLFANELDKVKLLESMFGNANPNQNFAHAGE
jgi:hypothetical protein